MAKSRVASWLELLLYEAISRPLRLLPSALWRPAGVFLGLVAWALVGNSRKIARRNLQIAKIGSSDRERSRIVRATFAEMGKTIVEVVGTERFSRSEVLSRSEVVGEEHLRAGLSRGKGVIVCVPHYSNWEWMASWAGCGSGVNVAVIVRKLDNPFLEAKVAEARSRKGVEILSRGWAGSGSLQALAKGGILGVMADQNAAVGGVFIPFFGVPASTLRGAHWLARKSGAAVVCGFEERLPKGRHRVNFTPEIQAGDDVDAFLRAIHAVFEKQIRKDPAPYFWVHPRWKKRPEGEASLYPGCKT